MRKFEKTFFLFLEINFIFAAPLSEREVPYSFDGMKPSWETMAESRKDMMDRTLKVTHKLYSRVVVEYDEYQRALLLIDNAAVKVAFEYFDDDGDGVVTKNEMMKFTETDLAKKEFKTDIIGSNDFMLIYLSRYWHFIDQDNTGSLDYYEFRKFLTDWMDIVIQVGFRNKYHKSLVNLIGDIHTFLSECLISMITTKTKLSKDQNWLKLNWMVSVVFIYDK